MSGTPKFQFVPGWQEIVPQLQNPETADEAIQVLEHRDEQIEAYLTQLEEGGGGGGGTGTGTMVSVHRTPGSTLVPAGGLYSPPLSLIVATGDHVQIACQATLRASSGGLGELNIAPDIVAAVSGVGNESAGNETKTYVSNDRTTIHSVSHLRVTGAGGTYTFRAAVYSGSFSVINFSLIEIGCFAIHLSP